MSRILIIEDEENLARSMMVTKRMLNWTAARG